MDRTLMLAGAALAPIMVLSLIASVSLDRSWRSMPVTGDTPAGRRRLTFGDRRFAYTGVGLVGLTLLLPAELIGSLRPVLLLFACTGMALGVYLLPAGAPAADGCGRGLTRRGDSAGSRHVRRRRPSSARDQQRCSVTVRLTAFTRRLVTWFDAGAKQWMLPLAGSSAQAVGEQHGGDPHQQG